MPECPTQPSSLGNNALPFYSEVTIQTRLFISFFLFFIFLAFVLKTLVTGTWWKLHVENFSVGIISVLIQGT